MCIRDRVSIDVGACFEGYHGDACRTFKVGKVDSETERLKMCIRDRYKGKGIKYVDEYIIRKEGKTGSKK